MLKSIGINKEKNMCAKPGIHKLHERESINIVAKSIVHLHITVELKAYCLSCFVLV